MSKQSIKAKCLSQVTKLSAAAMVWSYDYDIVKAVSSVSKLNTGDCILNLVRLWCKKIVILLQVTLMMYDY